MKLNYRNKVVISLFLISAGLTMLFQNCSNKNFTSQDSLLTDNSSFSAEAPQDCSLGGEIVAENTSRIFYLTSSVPNGSSCQYESRVCINGYFTGSYQYTSCAPAALNSCSRNGVVIPNGSSITSFQTPSVPYGQSCVSEAQTCNNGVLSGTYEFSTCSVSVANTCTFNGQTINNGQSVSAYKPTLSGSSWSCPQESRLCTNGNLDGTFPAASCSQGQLSCTFNGATVAHGSTVTAYSVTHAPSYYSTAAGLAYCNARKQTRTCRNGSFTGTNNYIYPSCIP